MLNQEKFDDHSISRNHRALYILLIAVLGAWAIGSGYAIISSDIAINFDEYALLKAAAIIGVSIVLSVLIYLNMSLKRLEKQIDANFRIEFERGLELDIEIERKLNLAQQKHSSKKLCS
ncbi:MAG: hypothetical protein IIB62_03685 [Proteobacteria bacterium]|nr:hypothetical protein [Pseudomonadota bacterium]